MVERLAIRGIRVAAGQAGDGGPEMVFRFDKFAFEESEGAQSIVRARVFRIPAERLLPIGVGHAGRMPVLRQMQSGDVEFLNGFDGGRQRRFRGHLGLVRPRDFRLVAKQLAAIGNREPEAQIGGLRSRRKFDSSDKRTIRRQIERFLEERFRAGKSQLKGGSPQRRRGRTNPRVPAAKREAQCRINARLLDGTDR